MGQLLLGREPVESPQMSEETSLLWLQQRAADHRYDPWLFFPRGLHWRWHSFYQLADHVARISIILESAVSASRSAASVAFWRQLCPGSISLSLATQVSGQLACPWPPHSVAGLDGSEPALWVGVEDDETVPELSQSVAKIVIPEARSLLESWTAESLRDSTSGWVLSPGNADEPGQRFSSQDIASAARAFDGFLEPLLLRESSRKEPLVILVGPSADSLQIEILVAWSLLRGAALVIEPQQEAVAASAVWARPQIVLTSSEALEDLAKLMGERFQLRNHRLRGLVATDFEAPSALARLRWEALGVSLKRWGQATAPIG